MCYLLIVKTHYRRDHLQFQCYYFRYMINSFLSWIHISNTMYDAIHLYVHLLELVYYVISFRVLEHFVSSKWKKNPNEMNWKIYSSKIFWITCAHTWHDGTYIPINLWVCLRMCEYLTFNAFHANDLNIW